MTPIRLLVAVLGGFFVLVGVGWLLGELITGPFETGLLEGIDRPSVLWLQGQRRPWLTDALSAITELGNAITLGIVLLVSVGWSVRRRPGTAVVAFLLIGLLGASALDNVVKELVDRARPPFAQIGDFSGSAFPSGHATSAAALFFGLATALTWGRPRNIMVAAWVVALVPAGLVALSRVYLGVHWMTDVIAGLLMGAGWVVLVAWALGAGSARSILPESPGRRGRVV